MENSTDATIAAAVGFLQIGLGTATANGPHEKNEDAAVIARLIREDNGAEPAAAAGSGRARGRGHGLGTVSIAAALTGCGLKSSEGGGGPGPRPSGGTGPSPVVVSSLDGSGVGDAAVVGHMAVVLDGHGGRGTAKWAARHLPRLVVEHMQRNPDGGISEAMSAALRSFDRWWSDAMHDPSISRHGHDDSGSTVVLALVLPSSLPDGGWHLALANLGDSRALLVAPGGAVRELSELHNTGNPDELERLVAAGAQVVHPQQMQQQRAQQQQQRWRAGAIAAAPVAADGHARFFPRGPIWGKRGLKVSRALGDVHFKRPVALVSVEPHCTELALPPSGGGGGPGAGAERHLLLMLTDGVTDVLTDGEITELAVNAAALHPGPFANDAAAQAAAEAVVAAAAAHAAAHDNMTCACVVLG